MKRATYTGTTIMAAFSRPKRAVLIRGQRVLVVKVSAGSATVQYDPTDPKHLDCDLGTTARILGVPMVDLEPVLEPYASKDEIVADMLSDQAGREYWAEWLESIKEEERT